MRFQDLKNRLKHEIVENNRRGTVQDFCDILEYDNENEVSAALAALENDGLVELVETKTRYREDGGAIIQGIYGPSSETLAAAIVKKIKTNKEYITKFKLNAKELEKTYPLLHKKISSEIHEARKKQIDPNYIRC